MSQPQNAFNAGALSRQRHHSPEENNDRTRMSGAYLAKSAVLWVSIFVGNFEFGLEPADSLRQFAASDFTGVIDLDNHRKLLINDIRFGTHPEPPCIQAPQRAITRRL
jgi:hypothetical protein